MLKYLSVLERRRSSDGSQTLLSLAQEAQLFTAVRLVTFVCLYQIG